MSVIPYVFLAYILNDLFASLRSIFSFLPPATTIRRYQRATLSTTSSEIGSIYCAILSYAHSRRDEERDEIVKSLVAVRSKLDRSAKLRTNVIYEVCYHYPQLFITDKNITVTSSRYAGDGRQNDIVLSKNYNSKRRPLPAVLLLNNRFRQLAYSLSHLLSVIEHLELSWTRAFLRRTRFLDPDFQGDVLAVISQILFLDLVLCFSNHFCSSNIDFLAYRKPSTTDNTLSPAR